jgi:hypothetical protein
VTNYSTNKSIPNSNPKRVTINPNPQVLQPPKAKNITEYLEVIKKKVSQSSKHDSPELNKSNRKIFFGKKKPKTKF